MSKILILFKLSQLNNLFELTQTYVNKYEQIDAYFMICDENINEEIKIEKNIIKFKLIDDNWSSLLIRVIKSFNIFKDKDYSNIIVSNVSTFINIPIMLSKINKDIKCYSYTGYYTFNNIYYEFPSGALYIFNNDLVKDICNFFNINNFIENNNLNNEFKKKYPTTDDIFFGYYLNENNINILKLCRKDLLNSYDIIDNLNYSHYRIKTCNYDIDNNFYLELNKKIYN